MINVNKKKTALVLLWVSVFLVSTFFVLFIIGSNSDYLISNNVKYIMLVLAIISFIIILVSIYMLFENKRYITYKKVTKIICSTIISLYVCGCCTFLFLLYGPVGNFRNWLITTAMATMNHQHYCKWFYSNETINKVLGENYIKGFDEDTDSTLIDFETDNKYANEYEKEILEHNEKDLYKIINFEVNGCKAYLAVVYDPSRISVGVTKFLGEAGQYVSTIAKNYDAPLAINGGGFYDPGYNSKGGYPLGVTIRNGNIISNNESGYGMGSGGIIGFNQDNVLVLMKNNGAEAALNAGVRDAVTMGPFLIVNGKSAFIKGNGGWGYAARTAIGQRKDGIVLMLVVDSNEFRTKGASMVDLTQIMERYGAVNAANLDGGTSSVMAVNGEIINDPIDSALRHKTRGIPTIFMVK